MVIKFVNQHVFFLSIRILLDSENSYKLSLLTQFYFKNTTFNRQVLQRPKIKSKTQSSSKTYNIYKHPVTLQRNLIYGPQLILETNLCQTIRLYECS